MQHQYRILSGQIGKPSNAHLLYHKRWYSGEKYYRDTRNNIVNNNCKADRFGTGPVAGHVVEVLVFDLKVGVLGVDDEHDLKEEGEHGRLVEVDNADWGVVNEIIEYRVEEWECMKKDVVSVTVERQFRFRVQCTCMSAKCTRYETSH